MSATYTVVLGDEYDSVELDALTHDGRHITVGVMVSGADGSILVQVDTYDDTGNVRIFVNDGDPVLDEDPEAGRYRDMSEEGSDGP